MPLLINKNLHQTFNVWPSEFLASETNLFVEVSKDGLSFFIQNIEDKAITGLCAFDLENKQADAGAADIIAKIFESAGLLKAKFSNVWISYSLNESLLTPGLYYNANKSAEYLSLVYGDLQLGKVFTDRVAEKNIYNTYRVPVPIHQVVSYHFSEALYSHQYSLLLKQPSHNLNSLSVIFYQNKIILSLKKEGKPQIIQAFRYVTASDVIYHMLNICKQFNCNDVFINLCGMIQSDSLLYTEIKKYFSNISFDELPKELSYSDDLKELPHHFFSHLYSFALCV